MPTRQRAAPRAPATLRTVADSAGVSAMTVSNVINGKGKVGAETRARVREAIRRTGYVPNLAARRLAGAAGTRIALIYPEGRSPYLVEVLLGSLAGSNAAGAQLIVKEGTAASVEAALQLVMEAIDAGAEGLLLVPPYAELLARSPAFRQLGLPAVAISAAAPLPAMMSVRIDNRRAAEQLTCHLIQQGHRNIGFIGGPAGNGDSAERRAGFRQAMRAHGLPVRPPSIQRGRFTFQSGCEAAERLLDAATPPSAILASNDDMALGVLWVAQRRGLSVPRDLAVAAFDDTTAARRAWPPLTVATQPVAAMTAAAVEAIMAALVGRGGLPSADVVLAHEVLMRLSTTG